MAENKSISIPDVAIDSDFDKHEIFQIFVVWNSIPYLMKNPPPQKNGVIPRAMDFAVGMGIDDEDLLNLIDIPTQKAFGERYNIAPNTMTRWKRHIKEKRYNDLFNIRAWAMELTNNIVMSLYNHTMKKGNPLNFQTWFKVINEWKDKSEVEHKLTPIRDIEHTDYVYKDPAKTHDTVAEDIEAERGLSSPQG